MCRECGGGNKVKGFMRRESLRTGVVADGVRENVYWVVMGPSCRQGPWEKSDTQMNA